MDAVFSGQVGPGYRVETVTGKRNFGEVLLKATHLCLILSEKGLGVLETLPGKSGIMDPNMILSSCGFVLES